MSRLDESVKLAIAAALASGTPKLQIAKQFKVSRPTIDIIEARGKSFVNSANPLSDDWREDLTHRSIRAMKRIDEIEDASKAVNAGVTIAKGLGVIGNDNQVSIKLEQWFSGPVAQRITAEWATREADSISDGDKSEV